MRDFRRMAETAYPKAVELRRELHRRPELSGHEINTAAFIAKRLSELKIEHTVYPDNAGIVGIVGKGEPSVGLRADYDALPIAEQTGLPYASENPGVMHACGHDIHTATLLGVAEVLKGMESSLKGSVKLFFQPNEEAEGGGERMVALGCMENPAVKNVLALHIDPSMRVGQASFQPGKTQAEVISLKINVHGSECHGAHPNEGVDAIVVAAEIVGALQTVNSRLTMPAKPTVVTIGTIHGGTKNNIITGEVEMTGTIRVLETTVGESVKIFVRRIAENVAAAWGATADVELTDEYPALTNDRKVTLDMAHIAEELLGRENVIYVEDVSMGADDFAYFTSAAPGCYFNIGTVGEGQKAQKLHSPYLAPDEGCILTGITLLTAGALHLLEDEK